MALNPTDIDVTNQFLITHMTEKQLKELESSESGLPENAIITTSDIDENISCLRTEVVYDMKSSDANINWGYPNGIGTGVTINKDFSKYNFLVCEYLSYNNSIVGFCDLTQPTTPSGTTGRYILYAVAYIENGYNELVSVIDLNKSSLTTYLPGSGVFASKIAKIYGILKTPSMIYTGDELIAGNGIKIENGVVSRIPLYKGSITQSFNTQQTTTSSTQIANASFNKVLNNSSIVVNYSCPLINTSDGYGTFIFLKIDGQEQGPRCLRNSSGMFCLNTIISNISAGSHTIEFWYGCGGGSASIPAYEQITATIMEVL